MQWFAVRKQLHARPRLMLAVMSFLLPLLVWSLFSYVPWLWHPKVEVTAPGEVAYFKAGQLVDKDVFQKDQGD
jgi:NitT/TauT family transport system permease protein